MAADLHPDFDNIGLLGSGKECSCRWMGKGKEEGDRQTDRQSVLGWGSCGLVTRALAAGGYCALVCVFFHLSPQMT